MTESLKTPSIMTTGAKSDEDRCGVDGPNVDYIVTHEREARDSMEHDNRTHLVETLGARDESPSSIVGRV